MTMEQLEQFAFECSKLIQGKRFKKLLDKIDEFWNSGSPTESEARDLLVSLTVSGYTIASLRTMMKSFADGDCIMQRAIRNYPELSVFRERRLENINAAIENGVRVEQKTLDEARRDAEL